VSSTGSTTSASGAGGRDQQPAGRRSFFAGLYSGSGAFQIVGRRRIWYLATLVLFLVCVGAMVFRGFNLGIDFEGGTRVQLPATGANGQISTEQVEQIYTETLGRPPVTVQTVGGGDGASILVRSAALDAAETVELKAALFTELQPLDDSGRPSEETISDSAVSASWGGEISQQALIALIVFLVLVSIFLAVYFEFRMAIAALLAMIFDVVVTSGIYSMVGFEVTPATVIGLLTILGFSLYDTVVVFDRVQENTRGLLGLTRRTYPEAANLAVNQTLMRSINTSFIAVLPVLGLLVVGVGLLGVGTLKDLALVQLVGIISGVFSSIFIATPVLVDLTMRRPADRQQAERVAQRRANAARRSSQGEEPAADAAPRRETAMAGATARPATPARVGKSVSAGRSRTSRPSGKAGRPSGKKRR